MVQRLGSDEDRTSLKNVGFILNYPKKVRENAVHLSGDYHGTNIVDSCDLLNKCTYLNFRFHVVDERFDLLHHDLLSQVEGLVDDETLIDG